MSYAALEAAWEERDGISPATKGEVRDAIEAALTALDGRALGWLAGRCKE
jgi:2,3,4,5-tetrahydropyridine-2-carboxylate N-succinyltransferase